MGAVLLGVRQEAAVCEGSAAPSGAVSRGGSMATGPGALQGPASLAPDCPSPHHPHIEATSWGPESRNYSEPTPPGSGSGRSCGRHGPHGGLSSGRSGNV